MVHYRRGRRLHYSKHTQQSLKQLLALLTCVVLVGASLETGIIQVVPQNITRLFSIPGTHRLLSLAARQHAGSSGPPPQGVVSAFSTTSPSITATPTPVVGCRVFGPPHAGLALSSVPELRQLALYEQLCEGAVAQRSSFFVPTPTTPEQAQTSAQSVAATLLAYAQYGVKPLVFMEPDDLDGNNLDLASYANGTYDSALNTYFADLKAAGITPGSLGMWVYLPEGNLPVWSTTDPTIYAAVVTRTAQLQKSYFPGSQASLMLDSESYAPGASWGNGQYVSLLPYVQKLPKGLFDSFGLQGFPWAAPANQPTEGSLYDPHVYLRTDFAVQAAQALAITNIWFNTGTFNQMYAGQAGQTVTNTPAQRQQMLSTVVSLVHDVAAKGYTTSIHLFAENKAKTSEATDWSYWDSKPGDTASTATFITFAHDAANTGIAIWIYDG